MDFIARDLSYVLRTLRRAPLFAGFAITTLAVGLGANATLFSLLNGVLFNTFVHAYPVGQRHREFGIRIALGATNAALIGMIMRHGMRVLMLGLVPSVTLVLIAAGFFEPVLYEVSPRDPLSVVGDSCLMAAVCYVPAIHGRLRGIAPTVVRVIAP